MLVSRKALSALEADRHQCQIYDKEVPTSVIFSSQNPTKCLIRTRFYLGNLEIITSFQKFYFYGPCYTGACLVRLLNSHSPCVSLCQRTVGVGPNCGQRKVERRIL